MRNLTPVAALCAALAVGGCAGTDFTDQFKSASELIQKGQKITQEGAEKLAIGFDAYCSQPSPGLSETARGFVRAAVNAALEKRGSKYRASNFCQKVE